MATFKEISSADITTSRSFLNQLVDVIQEDISGSLTRQKYQVFVTGTAGAPEEAPGVTSSLFHTVHDQDFTLQTANPIFDMTVGMNRDYVVNSPTGAIVPTDEDDAGKLSFSSNTLMMREKINIYRQFAQLLLNDADGKFAAPFGDTDTANSMDNAFFVCYKRLFSRDAIKRETYAMKFYTEAVYDGEDAVSDGTSDTISGTYTDASTADTDLDGVYDLTATDPDGTSGTENINGLSYNAVEIFTDVGSSTSQQTSYGGAVGNIVRASDTTTTVGLMFYDHGIAVYDLSKILFGGQHVSGSIDAVTAEDSQASLYFTTPPADVSGLVDGKTVIGAVVSDGTSGKLGADDSAGLSATFIPDLMVSGSIDNILDHIAQCRFGDSDQSAMTFQNVTNINSTLVFCRATADEFNYSSNPTFTDAENRIVVIDQGSENTQRSFSFITSVGLYDANNSLLAVAKLSRPIEKNLSLIHI